MPLNRTGCCFYQSTQKSTMPFQKYCWPHKAATGNIHLHLLILDCLHYRPLNSLLQYSGPLKYFSMPYPAMGKYNRSWYREAMKLKWGRGVCREEEAPGNTESQSGWGWKGFLEDIWSNPPAQAVPPSASCPGWLSNISKKENSTPTLGSLCQCLLILTVK